MTQRFKGDPTELKFEGALKPVFDRANADLDLFWADAYDSTPWLLLLYDQKRMPYAERINRDAFVAFITEALDRFPFTGTFDTYIFVLRAVFGQLSEIVFTVPAPGKLQIDVNATSALEFNFTATDDWNGAGYTDYDMITMGGDQLVFRGVSGIETKYELELLFSELMPAGIFPIITLTFFNRSDFVAQNADLSLDNVVDFDGNQLVFNEIG